MLTHTFLLQNILEQTGIKHFDPDIFVYNIVPDLLTIHPGISSQQTHNIRRLLKVPSEFPKSAYVMFHLLVDDLAHYGAISAEIPDDFNPDSQGYSYLKGRPLIIPILDFHKRIKQEISYNEASYRSHLVVEMIYDLIILEDLERGQSIDLLAHAVRATEENYMNEFVATINWLYGFSEEEIRDVMKKAAIYLSAVRMQGIMNIEGRACLYINKFHLHDSNESHFEGIKDIFLQAMELLDDKKAFLQDTARAIHEAGWLPNAK